MTIIIKTVFVEAHWSIDVVERYHAELRRAYQIIFEDLDVSEKIALQMIVKAINDTVDSDDLVLILLIFEAYLCMHAMNLSISSIIQRTMIIEKAMIEIRKFRAERQIVDVLNNRNDLIIISIHDLFLNSDVLIWRKDNVNQHDKWIESFKLLSIENETCKIALSSESIDFWSTVIKSFLIKSFNKIESIDENVQLTSDIEDVQSSDHQNNLSAELFELTRLAITRFTRARRLALRYQNVADIIVFLQDENSHSNQFEDVFISILTLISIFMKSRRKEINDLLKKRVFELITINAVSQDVRIFNFRFVDEIKYSDIADVYEKFRLVIQAYNDHDKTLMLTKSSTIQRMSQRTIFVLIVIIKHYLYLRDIIQTYVQSKISLNREFFIRSSSELDLSKNSILRVVKFLYDVSKAETHWFNIYQKHHKEKLSIIEFIFDSCLLHIEFISHFGIVRLQTDDTLILADDDFAELEEKKLNRVKLTFKKREKLILITLIKLNDELVIQIEDFKLTNSLNKISSISSLLTQSKQFDQIKLINLSFSINLTSSREKIRKMITFKNRYVAQRARNAYIATISQFEAIFDLLFAAQIINFKEKYAKRLN